MLRVIRGDVFEFSINIRNVDPIIIEKVAFISKDLDVEWEAEKDDNIYRIRIPGEDTAKFKLGYVKYDLVATFMDGEKLTIEHRQMVEVCDRVKIDG